MNGSVTKIIDYSKIRDMNIDSITFLKWIEESILLKSSSDLPAKISMTLPDNGFFNVMPCAMPSLGCMGVKIINRYPGRVPSLDSQIFLYDYLTGNLEAVIDGNYITAMRTGAVAAHSINLLAKRGFKTIGLIGLGNTAYATVDILIALFKDRNIEIKLFKYKGQEKAFMERYSDKNVRFTLHDSHNELMRDTDVVLSCVTYTNNDFCTEDAFKDGCTVVPVHTKGFMCCDTTFDKVFTDDTSHVAKFQNFDKFKNLNEVASVVEGKCPGRENDSERILVYNTGVGVHDIFFAKKIFDTIEPSGSFDTKPPKKKHWV